ncbi:ABC transporter ATP-binding protein [Pseudomonas monteilii]|uniref:ABC transporter ATP-binding protein n=1 Tax=Pseudomonas monteilii TaxID=76759 RepID=UPI003CFC2BDE
MKQLLKVSGVSKAYGGLRVLESVDFEINEGEIVGVIGPNGSGKSTMLNAISGFTDIDSGEVQLGGKALHNLRPHSIVENGIARTFQLPAMPDKMTVMEVIMAAYTRDHGLWGSLFRSRAQRQAEDEAREKASGLLKELLLEQVRDNAASALSGGQKKLLSVACALMGSPRLLMLDEPTAGVHPNLRQEMVATLKRINSQGLSMMVVEHDMHFIGELCDRCIVLDRGHIVASCKPSELSNNERVLEAYLGRSARQAKGAAA